jgi:hypothetical protein
MEAGYYSSCMLSSCTTAAIKRIPESKPDSDSDSSALIAMKLAENELVKKGRAYFDYYVPRPGPQDKYDHFSQPKSCMHSTPRLNRR